MHTLLIVPTSSHVGLTSASVGLVRAFDRLGIRVGFYKPISQSYHEKSKDLSTAYVRAISTLTPPEPLSMEETESMIASGNSEDLLEKITDAYQQVREAVDVVIVEGLQASSKNHFLNELNPRIAKALNAEVVMVASTDGSNMEQLNRRVESMSQKFGEGDSSRIVGVLVNQKKLPSTNDGASNLTCGNVVQACPAFNDARFKLLGVIPFLASLTHHRVCDITSQLNAEVIHEGESTQRRVQKIHLCARSISHISHVFHAGSLIVTPADRSDVIIASAYAALKGVALAGLILTGDTQAHPEVIEFCRAAMDSGLPVLSTEDSSFEAARALSEINPEIPDTDTDRLSELVDHIARHLDTGILRGLSSAPSQARLSPPAFRHQISKIARSKPMRIILPEGEEPRTLQAACICSERQFAQPVLLGNKQTIQDIAERNGLELPLDIQIIDPGDCREDYVPHLMEMRKHKNLNYAQASSQLENNIDLATVMLARGEVDGLVAGAINSTANTIRPALQLIKTAPGVTGVSSVFFMCLPDQVLVYGDCAVNLDPAPQALADIAVQSARTAEAFGIDPRIAMISYSTHESGSGEKVEKVREATHLVQQTEPEMMIDGPLQYDAASDPRVARTKAPGSQVAGNATVFIFPDLNTGNTTYKAVQRAGNVISMGPVLQGLRKPVNDLSRGASVEDIVFTIAITSIQAQQGA